MFSRTQRPRLLIIYIATAAIMLPLSAATLRAQTPPTNEKQSPKKMSDADQPQKTDADKKQDNEKEKVEPRRPAVRPRPARRTGLEIPEPTVELKPGEVPAIKFDTPVYDFGRVQAGGDIVHDFFFTNTGNGPLELLRVKPSCGCTTAGEYTRIVQPGATGKIPIKLSTKKGGGNISKSVTVNTNIPGPDATVRLEIKGTVWQPIEVTPRSAAFGRLTVEKANEGMERRLTIVSNVDQALKPSITGSDNKMFKAELKPLEDGKKYEIVVGLVPPLSSGNNTGKITVTTGIADPATVEVPAYAFVTAPLDVTPTQLTIMPGRTAALKRQFYIRCNDGKSFDVKDLKCSSDALALELTDIRGNKQTYRLSVDIPADYAPPASGDRITFDTTHPAVPSLEIPVISRGAPVAPAPRRAAARPTAVPPTAVPAKPAPAKPATKTEAMKAVD